MPPRDKVLSIAFAVCAAFSFGDHLAFNANFQPNMVAPLIIGKLAGGVIAILLALWLALPYTAVLEAKDRADGTIARDEYAPQPINNHQENVVDQQEESSDNSRRPIPIATDTAH